MNDYVYRTITVDGKSYRLPRGVAQLKRRGKMWIEWQKLGLPLPKTPPPPDFFARIESRRASAA